MDKLKIGLFAILPSVHFTAVLTAVWRRYGMLGRPVAQGRNGTVVRLSVRPTVLDGYGDNPYWKLITMRTSYEVTSSQALRRARWPSRRWWRIISGRTAATCSRPPNHSAVVPTAFHYLIGPLYMLTLLYNFNLRAVPRGNSDSGSRRSEMRLTVLNDICMDSIRAARSSVNTNKFTPQKTEVSLDTESVTFAEKRGSADLWVGDNTIFHF
ncbi:hypothetical protein B0H14DRAFT_2587625 [Mycena olivaceomarginata]|nr:hypothetical protein B0H14DRAFT_2587625 [Mycena olivaceomarginata]